MLFKRYVAMKGVDAPLVVEAKPPRAENFWVSPRPFLASLSDSCRFLDVQRTDMSRVCVAVLFYTVSPRLQLRFVNCTVLVVT